MPPRRKDIASLLRNVERPISRGTYMGVASVIGGDGKSINGEHLKGTELSSLSMALPYGISSSGVDGVRVQIITNDNQNNVAVGVIDDNRPPVKSGCIVIYDKAGSTIALMGDGDVHINGISFNNLLDRIEALEKELNI